MTKTIAGKSYGFLCSDLSLSQKADRKKGDDIIQNEKNVPSVGVRKVGKGGALSADPAQ